MNWEVVNDNDQAKIKVIGVGGFAKQARFRENKRRKNLRASFGRSTGKKKFFGHNNSLLISI